VLPRLGRAIPDQVAASNAEHRRSERLVVWRLRRAARNRPVATVVVGFSSDRRLRIRHDRLPIDRRQLDDGILRTDAIRWSLRTEGVEPLPEGGIRILEPRPQERRALESADRRITGLVDLKAQKGCPGRASAVPGMTDLDILVKLRAVTNDSKKDRYSRWRALNERTCLLDGLCDPQAIRAGQSAKP